MRIMQKMSVVLFALAMLVGAEAYAQSSQASDSPAGKTDNGSDVLQRRVGTAGDKSRSPGGLGGWMQTLLALALVVALIFAVRFVVRRLGRSSVAIGSSGAVKVIAAANVSPRERLFVVRFGGRVLLVGSSPSGLRTLSEVSDEKEVADLLTCVDAPAAKKLREGMEGADGKSSADVGEDEA